MTEVTTKITTTEHPAAGKIIEARGGLPFLEAGTESAGFEPPTTPKPREAAIVKGGKGGGAESGPFDGGSGAGDA